MKKLYFIFMMITFISTITISYAVDTVKKIDNQSNRNLTVAERVELSNIADLVSVESITVYDDIISIQAKECYTNSECEFTEYEILETNKTMISEIIF